MKGPHIGQAIPGVEGVLWIEVRVERAVLVIVAAAAGGGIAYRRKTLSRGDQAGSVDRAARGLVDLAVTLPGTMALFAPHAGLLRGGTQADESPFKPVSG